MSPYSSTEASNVVPQLTHPVKYAQTTDKNASLFNGIHLQIVQQPLVPGLAICQFVVHNS